MTILSLLFLSFEPILTVLAIIGLTRWRKLIHEEKVPHEPWQCVNVCSFKVQGYVTHAKGCTFKVYSISTRLQLNNHRSLFFYLNIFCFFELWRHLAAYDATWQPLPVNLVLRYMSLIWLFGSFFYFKIAGKNSPVLPFFYLIIFCKFTTENILGIKKGITDS